MRCTMYMIHSIISLAKPVSRQWQFQFVQKFSHLIVRRETDLFMYAEKTQKLIWGKLAWHV